MLIREDQFLTASFIQRATQDLAALSIPPNECRERYLAMLAKWASTPDRELAATDLPLHLFEIETDRLSDEDAEREESAAAERFRNIYRQFFGDRTRFTRTYVRREVRAEWCLFVSIFAMINPECAARWSEPDLPSEFYNQTVKRSLRAHGRRPLSDRAIRRSDVQTAHEKSAAENSDYTNKI